MRNIFAVLVGLVFSSLLFSPLFLSASNIGKPGGYALIQDEGSGLTQRTTLNFAGAGVTCADATTKTTCTIPGGGGSGGYDQIQDEGMDLTQRSVLNFEGAGVTCADATTKTTCTIPGGGGGGADPVVDTFANVAASACSGGQMGLTTDSIYSGICKTANTWGWLWGSLLVTPPDLTSCAWTNQGGSTATTVGGALVLTMPGSAAQWRNYLCPVPSTPYTTYIRLSEQDLGSTSAAYTVDGVGACFGDGSGKFVAIYVLHQNAITSFGILVEKWTNFNSFSASAGGVAGGGDSSIGKLAYSPRMDFRLVDDGTNTTYSYAADGRTWVTFFSEPRTSFFAAGPTVVGSCSRVNASANGTIVTMGDKTFQ